MGTLAERQMEAVLGAASLIPPGVLEAADQGVLQLLRDLTDIVAEGPGHLLDHQPAVRFAAEGQEDLTDTLREIGLGARRRFAEVRVGGDFQGFLHGLQTMPQELCWSVKVLVE